MEFENYKLTGSEELETLMGFTLEDETQGGTTTDPAGGGSTTGDENGNQQPTQPFNWLFTVIILVVFAAIILWFFFSGRKNKTNEREYVEAIEAIRPGNKVTSRGGICGIVVEVCDDNTVILETGSEASGKSRVKLMKECIYETDAKGPTQLAREEAELRRKQEKEEKMAAKQSAAAPAQDEEPAEEEPSPEQFEPAEPASPAESDAPSDKTEE